MDTIRILMPPEDLEMINKVFQDDDQPSFTVIKTEKYSDWATWVELYTEATCSIWFLAKRAQQWKTFHEEKPTREKYFLLEIENRRLKEELNALKQIKNP